jgi:hypothetical protein
MPFARVKGKQSHVSYREQVNRVSIKPASICDLIKVDEATTQRQRNAGVAYCRPSTSLQRLIRLDRVNRRDSRPSTSLQRLKRLDRVNRRDRFSMKKPLSSSARGASFHTKHVSNVNAIETY